MSAHQPSGWVFLALLLLVASNGLLAGKNDKPGYLSPPELFELVEESKVAYTINSSGSLEDVSIEQYIDAMWPSVAGLQTFPKVTKSDDGSLSLTEYVLEDGCIELLEEGELLFAEKDYAGAVEFYARAAERFPSCYIAHSHVGDCHYFRGDFEEAIGWYDKAIALNPVDYRSYFYRGNTLTRLGQRDEALRAYAQSLALKPHNPNVYKALSFNADQLRVALYREPFRPRALARAEGDGFAVYADLDSPHWLVYGLCKAAWLAEPEHREQRTDSREHPWTTTEERQCLLSTLESYVALKEDGTVQRDEQMERLLTILEDDLLTAFTLYELGSRVGPTALVLLSEDVHEQLVTYVHIHVLQPLLHPGSP